MKMKTSTLLALSLSLGLLTTNNLEVFASEMDEDSEQSIIDKTNIEEVEESVEVEEIEEIEEVEEVEEAEKIEEVAEVEETEEEQKDGWVEEGGSIFYYENGKKITGWKEISSNWYYFDEENNGAMSTGWKFINNSYYFFYESGIMQGEGKEEINGKTYRFTASGKMITGWYDDDYYGWEYYHTSGSMASGWTKVENDWYYFNESGYMYSGTMFDINGKTYRFRESGEMVTGWYDDGWYDEIWINDWQYYHTSGSMATGWTKVKNNWYYLDESGSMVTGTHTIGRKDNVFSSKGVWEGTWEKNSKGIWFKEVNGKYPKNQWSRLGDTWYYFDKNGYVNTGWKKINNRWYYFNDLGEMHADTKSQINGEIYFFDKSGAMRTQGWYDNGYYIPDWNEEAENNEEIWVNNWHYISKSGAASIGWTKVKNKWYYFNYYGSMVTGEEKIDRKTNIFSTSGVWEGTWEESSKGIWFKEANGKYPKNQWKRLGYTWYHFDKNGYVNTGWKKIDNKWYYFDELGRMNDEEVVEIKGTEYRFNTSGSLYTGWYDDGYYYWDLEAEKDIWVSDWKYYTINGAVTNAWKKINDKCYYFDGYGSMVTGEEYIDGAWHEFATDGTWLGKLEDY